ncbi:hypothetical protein BD626DRAFT_544849 [Schizophyllum amplum]|uniref:Uncharacterized protein n=1 Tax=Schizophyllum amplum TaxID=97359 RepID=A0A550D0J7_9AGAR|nr:hypothetical protein BD626DRAFT_544849 [Auriculariopsis ampla]
MQSNVGNSQIYNDGDQREHKDNIQHERSPFDAGAPNSHQNLDSKDQRTIGNRLAAAEKAESPKPRTVEDPLKPAQAHGNEPSRGAKVDAELQEEDELRLKEKGIKH